MTICHRWGFGATYNVDDNWQMNMQEVWSEFPKTQTTGALDRYLNVIAKLKEGCSQSQGFLNVDVVLSIEMQD